MMSLIAWTWSCVRPYRGRMVTLSFIAAANITLGLLAPWPLKLVVDNVLAGHPLPAVLALLQLDSTGAAARCSSSS